MNIPLDNVEGASGILQRLNHAPEEELNQYISSGRMELQNHYAWDRFAGDISRALRAVPAVKPSDPEWLARASANKTLLSARLGGGK